ncbi:MAG: cation-transporting P-type ATPase [Syntrophobacteraceae bacterium]
MEILIGKHWHHLPEELLLDLLGAHPEEGLDIFIVEARREHFGPNVLIRKKGRGPFLRFLLQFHQPLVYILMAAGIVTAFAAEWVDASVILGVVLVNAIIGFMQESKAVRAIEVLARSMTTEATVIRSGETRQIESSALVPGDIVLLQSGDKVPADMRILKTKDLRIDESALTGESLPVSKAPDGLPHDTVLAERRNMVYASTLVTYGQGKGVVVATGNATEMGRISQLLSEVQSLKTPLTRRIEAFSRVLLIAILVLGAATFTAGLLHGEPMIDVFLAAVALTVGSIPEGLPAAVTIILAVGVSRMARRRAIIRRLPTVETLGSTTIICSDKTGTLTENQMTVREIVAGKEKFILTGAGYNPSGTLSPATEDGAKAVSNVALEECLRAGLLCNDSRLLQNDERWTIEGDPTEGALVVSARKYGLHEGNEVQAHPRLDVIPFESEHQYMATLHPPSNGDAPMVYLKGALEALLPRCTRRLMKDGREVSLDAGNVHKHVEAMASLGMRVLAFARKRWPALDQPLSHDGVATDLTFLGLQGMIDPPRREAVAAVKTCQQAGITVKMITGDHALTAVAIAEDIGILGIQSTLPMSVKAVTGQDMANVSDSELEQVAAHTHVFARVTPEQKLRLVKALQARGEVVAMTGDGVNDAPALKQADIGVAMGIAGTEVSKEAADMVLTDDNFASIEAAVEEGRCVFDNLLKFIVWALPANLGQGLVILTAVFAGIVLPILPVQCLWINMTTAGSLGLMLAFEPREKGIMLRPPRHPLSPLLSRELVARVFLVGILLMAAAFGLFEWKELTGATHAQARTVAVNAFAVTSALYLLNCRSLYGSYWSLGILSNPGMLLGIGIMVVLQLGFTYLPIMNSLFHTEPIGLDSWAGIVAAAVVVHAAVGLQKFLANRFSLESSDSESDESNPLEGSVHNGEH